MAYATVDQLAAALRVRVTAEITDQLQSALDSTVGEIDGFLDRLTPLPVPPDERVVGVNINRGVEWYKAADAVNGGIGFDQIGTIARPTSGFERYARILLPLKEQWGVG